MPFLRARCPCLLSVAKSQIRPSVPQSMSVQKWAPPSIDWFLICEPASFFNRARFALRFYEASTSRFLGGFFSKALILAEVFKFMSTILHVPFFLEVPVQASFFGSTSILKNKCSLSFRAVKIETRPIFQAVFHSFPRINHGLTS